MWPLVVGTLHADHGEPSPASAAVQIPIVRVQALRQLHAVGRTPCLGGGLRPVALTGDHP